MMILLLSALLVFMVAFSPVKAVLPPQNPPWPPTYNMHESLITMQNNSSGFSSPHRGAEFGIVSYDWSNAKALWAADKPMSCEELLLMQAVATKQAADGCTKKKNVHVFVYRNIVKALPWFKAVRDKLDDPAFEGFFLKFDPLKQGSYHVPDCAPENQTHCSVFYHDQEQTPEVPTPTNPHPDGSCTDGRCDCGVHPCGEYLFDHRNGTMLREFIINDLILSPTALGHPAIDGLFLDDYWCSDLLCEHSNNTIAGCPCNDPVQGPTEIDRHSQFDMSLTDQDIRDMTVQWNETMSAVERAILQHGGYTWSLIPGQEYANAWPTFLKANATQCAESLRQACSPDSVWQRFPVLFGFSVNGTVLTQLEQDLAFFLLARGPYAFAGWGVWGMQWPFNAEPRHGQLPPLPHGVPLPKEFDVDYGVPEGLCRETRSGVFHREWSLASVQLDCNSFVAGITEKQQEEANASNRFPALGS